MSWSGSSEGACSGELPLRALRVRVRPDRVEVEVAVAARRGQHACRNSVGPVFASVMKSTSTPHLLEHLIIDAQTRAAKDPDRVFTGTTQWSAQDASVAKVAFSYEDDLVALNALNQALLFLNQALIELRG